LKNEKWSLKFVNLGDLNFKNNEHETTSVQNTAQDLDSTNAERPQKPQLHGIMLYHILDHDNAPIPVIASELNKTPSRG